MRIIGGQYRGRALAGPPAGDKSGRLRPTTDRVRESLFNLLTHGPFRDPPLPQDTRVLDLFAGTGALGLEALSRGAAEAVFVEKDHGAREILNRNIAALGLTGNCSVIAGDAGRLRSRTGEAFNLLFLDPPYGKGLGERALESVIRGGWIADGAIVVWEEAKPPNPPPGLVLADTRAYGNTSISIFRYMGQ